MPHRLTLAALCVLTALAGTTAVAAEALADEGTPTVSVFEDVRTAVPAASFRVPAAPACNKGDCDPCNPCCKRLRFSVSLVGWLTAMNGDATVAGRDVDVDISTGDVIDLLDKVDGLLQGNVRADYGKWFARFGISYIGLGDDVAGTVSPGPGPGVPVSGTVGITQAYYQFVVGYNVKNVAGPRVGCCCSTVRFDTFAGARWADMEVSIVAPGPSVERSRDWVDPIVGGIATWDLRNRWILHREADIGGFGVNADLTWRLRLGAQYTVNRWLGVVAGYQFLDYDYTTGTGTSRFEWDVLSHGPYVGLNFRF